MSDNEHSGAVGELIPAGGGDLCLGFVNTRYWRGRPMPTETLTGFGDLRRWLAGDAALPVDLGTDWESTNPAQAAKIFSDAVELREAIYRIFSSVAVEAAVDADDLAALNRALAGAPARVHLALGSAGFAWQAATLGPSMPALLAPIIWSAADLLIRADRYRIRRCANDECLWLFVDASKTGTRRWCDMASCGNRAKSRRHYVRTKRN